MHDAFADAVSNGSITSRDAAALVANQATATVPDAARLGSYFEHLHDDRASEAMRTDLVNDSRQAARAAEAARPEAAGQLYAQTANVMADMPAADRMRAFADMQPARPDGIERFAAGASGGFADRLQIADGQRASGASDLAFRTDGLAAVMNATNDRVAGAERAGRYDPVATRESAQMFNGTTSYLAAAIGTPADRALGAHDDATGLRHALNKTLEANASTLLRENMMKNGTALSTEGVQHLASYARFQFDAPDTAHGVNTVTEAQNALGGLVGTLERSVASADHDRGAQLQQAFSAAFAPGETGAQNAARVTGQLIGTAQLGVQQGFEVRVARGDQQQEAARGMFERTAGIAQGAAKVAAFGGQEHISGLAETIETLADKAKVAVPKPELFASSEANALRKLHDTYVDALGETRNGYNNPFSDGYTNSMASRYNAAEQGADAKLLQAAAASRDNPLSQVLGTTVLPQGDTIGQPFSRAGHTR